MADQIGIISAQSLILEQETRQRRELIRSNEELKQFAFVASHDLQEPLRKIKSFGDRLKTTCGDTLTEQAQHITYILDYLCQCKSCHLCQVNNLIHTNTKETIHSKGSRNKRLLH